MTIRTGRVVDLTNLSGTFQFDDEAGLKTVAAELRKQGLKFARGAILPGGRFVARGLGVNGAESDRDPRRQPRPAGVMRRCLADRFYTFEHRFFNHAHEMVRFLESHLDDCIAIALDNDLEMIEGDDGKLIDPGSGRDVVAHLATHESVCPVILHTTNSDAAVASSEALKDAGWKVRRVIPFDDMNWIETEWFFTLRRAVVGPVKNVPSGSAA